jgi:hypothetical protein
MSVLHTGKLETHLLARREAGRKLLVPYITGGYLGWTDAVRAAAANGADAIEIGIPFSDPVMDMEFLGLDYDSDSVLLSDAGALNLLASKHQNSVIATQLPQKLTLEVVYGHAWALGKHLAKAQDDVAYIDLNQIGRKTRNDSA